MIGTTDQRLMIDRVGADADVLGYEPAELLGRSLLSLVDGADVPLMLGALAQAFTTRHVVTTATIGVRTRNGQVLSCEAVLVPLVPAPSSAFALFPEVPDEAKSLSDVQRLLQRFSERIAAIDLSTNLVSAPADGRPDGVTRLTARELEIVRRLVVGDRVPVIAEDLFVSQSTVRNRLSSIYRKIGVHSQQELVHRFRVTDSASDRKRTDRP